jgi:ABC-type spermidine/putrescine transport system permease subunit II
LIVIHTWDDFVLSLFTLRTHPTHQLSAVAMAAVAPVVPANSVVSIMGFVFLLCGLSVLPVSEVHRRQEAAQQHGVGR